MKTTEKRMYNTPEIVLIELDNSISLALESSPPNGPGEGALSGPEYMNNDPYRANLG